MVDKDLPFGPGLPLRWLFLDLNSYFASVEQAENPDLRGKPMGVAPTRGDSGTVIAASYEAKKFGIRTGTKVRDAMQMCPEFIRVDATPAKYTYYHKRIIECVEKHLPVDKVCSIDEMRCRLLGVEREPERATEIARAIKRTILDELSPCLTSSIGIAPNAYLAKLATDLQKPDGLVVIESKELPERLKGLELTEFAGINRKMKARLNSHGIFVSDDLLDKSPQELTRAFGSVWGERWWYLLRGYDMVHDFESGKSLGHSNVLAPEFRTDEGARAVLLRLLHKACARLRADGWVATHLSVYVKGYQRSWSAEKRIEASADAIAIGAVVLKLWEGRDFDQPSQVGVTFTGLKRPEEVTLSLFGDEGPGPELGQAVDEVNQKFGKNSVFLASLVRSKDQASEKIAFNKTWLFKEGKDDHDWKPTGMPPGGPKKRE